LTDGRLPTCPVVRFLTVDRIACAALKLRASAVAVCLLAGMDSVGVAAQTVASPADSASSPAAAVIDNGQTVSFLHHTLLKVQRPNRLCADITGSRGPKGLVR
jgi:hypothetical protein